VTRIQLEDAAGEADHDEDEDDDDEDPDDGHFVGLLMAGVCARREDRGVVRFLSLGRWVVPGSEATKQKPSSNRRGG
jgi:hypothetical protein